MIPVFIGKVVTLVTANKPEELLAASWPWLLGMAVVLLSVTRVPSQRIDGASGRRSSAAGGDDPPSLQVPRGEHRWR